jgi:hypothetical protein
VDAKNKLVVEFEVTNEGTDNNQITPMVERTKALLGIDPEAVVADAGYDSVQDMVERMAHGATPHIAGTDFDICVPTDEPPSATVVAHKDGRCVYVAERNPVVSDGQHPVSGILQKPRKAGGVLQSSGLQKLRLHMHEGRTGAPPSGAYGREGFLEII